MGRWKWIVGATGITAALALAAGGALAGETITKDNVSYSTVPDSATVLVVDATPASPQAYVVTIQQAATAMVPQAAAVPVATGATFSRTLNMNMGGVNVNNGMDQAALVALIRRTIKDSLGV